MCHNEKTAPLLTRLYRKLRTLLMGPPPLTLEHELFGRLTFMGQDPPSGDDYWEAEVALPDRTEPLGLIINAPASGPGAAHVAFYRQALADPDALFERCRPLFEADFQQWTGQPCPANWRDAFELLSIEIPRGGNPENPWSLGYYVDAAGHYFTARFIDGQPACSEIDG